MAASGNRSILFYIDDWWACAWYRANVPGAELKRLGYDVVMDTGLKDEDFDRFDVIVFQRKHEGGAQRAIDRAKSLGKLTVYELDDDIWGLSQTNPAYPLWSNPQVAAAAAQAIRSVDLVTTATHPLAEKLRKFNPNVRVLPNMLPTDGWPFSAPKPQSNDHVVLGWAGSTSHVEDLNVLVDVVPQLIERYPQVRFLYAGGPAQSPFRLSDRVLRLDSTDIQHYPELIANFDIGLIPLVDNAFNRAKSDLKFVEYSMVGIPSVATKLEPYLRSVKHGENGFLASNAKDWFKFLTRLIEHPQLRLEIAGRAQEFARSRTIDKGIDKWIRAYGLVPPEEL